MSTREKESEKIGFVEKVAYGFGDVGCGLVNVLSNTYTTFFYTDAVGLNAALIGTIILFSKFLDGISDIMAGFIVDRTKSKYGKARVWVLRMSIPIAVCLILTFTVPSASGAFAYVYVAITYNLINTVCYTMANLPYGTLNSLMTRDQGERMVINTYRMTMAQVGAMITNMCTIPLVNLLGGSTSQRAWIIVATIYAVLAAAMLLFCFFKTKERVSVSSGENKEKSISVFKALKVAFSNQYWLILVCVGVLIILGQTISGTVGTYYAKYILGNENVVGVINAVNYAPALILIPCLPMLSKRIGKRNIALTGGVIQLAGQLLLMLNPSSAAWLVVCSLIKGCGYVMIMGTIFAMVADTIEFGEWKTGVRVEGVLYSTTSFGAKVGGGVGSAMTMGVLGKAGYDGLAAVQSEATLKAIRVLFLYFPITLILAIMPVLFIFYKLDKIYPQVMADLKEREQQSAAKE